MTKDANLTEFYKADLQKRENLFTLHNCLQRIHSKWSFQREKGLEDLLVFLRELSSSVINQTFLEYNEYIGKPSRSIGICNSNNNNNNKNNKNNNS